MAVSTGRSAQTLGVFLIMLAAVLANSEALSVAVPTQSPRRPQPPVAAWSSPKTTSLLGCQTPDGKTLSAGQQKTVTSSGACVLYQCSYQGTLQTVVGDCLPPMCVKPKMNEGDCCFHCPDGRNCKLPSGTVIPANQEVKYNGGTCKCPDQSYAIPGDWHEEHYMAICNLTAATTPAPAPISRPVFYPRKVSKTVQKINKMEAKRLSLTRKCDKMRTRGVAEKCRSRLEKTVKILEFWKAMVNQTVTGDHAKKSKTASTIKESKRQEKEQKQAGRKTAGKRKAHKKTDRAHERVNRGAAENQKQEKRNTEKDKKKTPENAQTEEEHNATAAEAATTGAQTPAERKAAIAKKRAEKTAYRQAPKQAKQAAAKSLTEKDKAKREKQAERKAQRKTKTQENKMARPESRVTSDTQ